MKKTTNIGKRVLIGSALLALAVNANGVTKVDLDMNGRNSSEVTETGYTAWVAATSNSTTIDGVTFTLANTSSSGELSANWYKVGVQSPNYAKLVCDCAYIKDGDKTSGLQLTITGLSNGTHTLLTYHNAVDDYSSSTVCDMDIYVNGSKVQTLTPTKRALSTDDAATAYLTFSGTSTTIKFMPNTSKTVDNYKVYLNGFALDVPNAALQASSPNPSNNDEHVAADNGSYSLSWTAASGATKHNVYFGTDSTTIANATTYNKQQSGTSYSVTGLSNLKTYWWRIDEVSSDGTVTKGEVWCFKPRHLAFPEAEGYGKYAIGGRGGKVVHVTNLNDDGEGSLRWAMAEITYPRTIVFDVAGVIELKSRLTQQGTHVTIAAQTAPGKGICVKAAPVGVGSESICRDFRVRLGSGDTYDGLGMAGAQYSITDHCSVSWTIDEAFSCRNGKNLTLQRTLISEALNIAGHKNYPAGTGHGYAATIGGDIGSFHHNLLAHNQGRNWSMGGGLDGDGYYAGRLDIFNNVVYNWWHRVCDGGAHEVNFVGNYYKRGAASEASNMTYCLSADLEGTGKGSQAYYFHNNIMAHQKTSDGFVFDGTDDTKGRQYTLSNGQELTWTVWNSQPFFESQASIESARNAYKSVLSDVGCNMPAIDTHDARMVTETINGTYSCTGSQSKVGGMIDASSESKEDWSEYTTTSRASDWDTDGDGMPNWWEEFYGFNTKSASGDFSESNGDMNGDGYTNLEDYLDWMATPHYETTTGVAVSFDVKQYFKGFTGTNTYSIANTPTNCTATVSGSKVTVTSTTKGIYYVSIKVKDNEGDTFTRRIGVKVDGESEPVGPATLTKNGAGSSSQSVKQDSAIVTFSYVWANASGVTVTGLPEGITATTDASQNRVTISGNATDKIGTYTYTIVTVGNDSAATKSGKITILPSGPATLTKNGAGRSSQEVKQDSAIVDFAFTWGNATGVTVEGLPNGINYSIDEENQKVSISGNANDEIGAYTYTVCTTGGETDSCRSAIITIVSNTNSGIATASTDKKKASLSPNPMDEVTFVNLENDPDQEIVWQVSNLAGAVLLQGVAKTDEQGKATFAIERGELTQGIYLLQHTINGKTGYAKLIVK